MGNLSTNIGKWIQNTSEKTDCHSAYPAVTAVCIGSVFSFSRFARDTAHSRSAYRPHRTVSARLLFQTLTVLFCA